MRKNLICWLAPACFFPSPCLGQVTATASNADQPVAQDPKILPSIPAPANPSGLIHLAAGTPFLIETGQVISSKTAKPGDRFRISLAGTVAGNGQTVLPSGLHGEGEVIHAAKARWGGKAGELIVNARFLDCLTVRLPIGRLHWANVGEDRLGTALAVSIAFTPALFLISGGEVEIPAGTRGIAKLTADVDIPSGACSPSAPSSTVPIEIIATPSSTDSIGEEKQ